jgi:hypothetical protein
MMLRAALDAVIFASRHLLVTAAALFVVWLGLSLWPAARRRVTATLRSHGRLLLIGAAAVTLVGFVTVGLWYATLDAYACEVEPLVTEVSWLLASGQPLYHAPEAAERYSVLYGPSVYLTNGLFLRVLGPSISAAKTGSLLAALASLAFLYLALRPRSSRGVAVVLCAAAALAYWTSGVSVYVVRPDAYLLAAVAFGLLCARRAPRTLAWLGVAVALGFAVNLKIHAGLYFLPVLAMLAFRHGWWRATNAVAAAVVLVVAPFLLHPAISLPNYLLWIAAAIDHGLDSGALPALAAQAVFFALPLILMLLAGGRVAQPRERHRSLLGLTALAAVVVVLLATKPGAGLVHLLPLATLLAVLAGDALADLRERHAIGEHLSPALIGAATIVAVVTLAGGWTTEYRHVMLARHITAEAPAIEEDLAAIMAAYPDRTVGMGYGGEGLAFERTYLRPLLTFAGHPLLLDAIAVMDAERSGIDLSAATIAALETGRIGVWLVPHAQAPFVKANWYPPYREIFPPSFRKNFAEYYRLDRSTPFFDCWVWQGGEASRSEIGSGTSASAIFTPQD